MDEVDFEGTLVLEQLAAVGRLDEFAEAIDSDDTESATELMRFANIDETTIAIVIRTRRATSVMSCCECNVSPFCCK